MGLLDDEEKEYFERLAVLNPEEAEQFLKNKWREASERKRMEDWKKLLESMKR